MTERPPSPPATLATRPEPALQAHEGTPRYGNFGHPPGPGEPPRDPPAVHDEMRKLPPNPEPQLGHVEQNQNLDAVRAAHNGTEAEMRASYALDDSRYAGGDAYNLREAQTDL